MKIKLWLAVTMVAMLFVAGCATTKPSTGFSGSYAVVRQAGDIPHVPSSVGKQARWSQTEVDQVLYLDDYCQKELFNQLPGWAQAIVKEGGWSALAVAVGEGAFASAFPGAEVAKYMLGGLGYGAFAGANTGRYRQDSSVKSSQSYCMMMQVWGTNSRYPGTLEGISIIPWYGNGEATLPSAIAPVTGHNLEHVQSSQPPIFGR